MRLKYILDLPLNIFLFKQNTGQKSLLFAYALMAWILVFLIDSIKID
jgi:hypothetical protein